MKTLVCSILRTHKFDTPVLDVVVYQLDIEIILFGPDIVIFSIQSSKKFRIIYHHGYNKK